MKREDFDIAAGIIDRMDKLEKTIFKLEEIRNKKNYAILASNDDIIYVSEKLSDTNDQEANQLKVSLTEDDLATVIFSQDVLILFIDTLNLELDELRKSFEDIST